MNIARVLITAVFGALIAYAMRPSAVMLMVNEAKSGKPKPLWQGNPELNSRSETLDKCVETMGFASLPSRMMI